VQREHLLKAEVARYLGCLSNLPATQRELLELRTGLGVPRPLDPGAAAARMHLDRASFTARERQALRELRGAAALHECSEAGGVLAGVALFSGGGFGSGPLAGPAVGVDAARYAASPTGHAGHRSVLGSLLGTDMPPLASDVLLVLLLAIAVGVGVVIVTADAAGVGPRHRHWRQSVAHRMRQPR